MRVEFDHRVTLVIARADQIPLASRLIEALATERTPGTLPP